MSEGRELQFSTTTVVAPVSEAFSSEIQISHILLQVAAAECLGLEPVRRAIHVLQADDEHRHVLGNNERDAFAMRLEEWVEGIRRRG